MRLIFLKADQFPNLQLIGNNEVDDDQSVLLLKVCDHLFELIASNDPVVLFK